MNRLKHTSETAARRRNRTRSTMTGTTDRPRLSVFISNAHISAQIIDDSKGKTLAAASSVGLKLTGSMTEKAAVVGEAIAKQGTKVKVKKVVFDRGSKLYHGRIKALAEAARQNGLEF